MFDISTIGDELGQVLEQMADRQPPQAGDIFVVGCSTSEVQGAHIGKSGSMDVAAAFFPVLTAFARKYDLKLAFQCCEHLNRTLIVERETMRSERLTQVSVVPHRRAGGSMASYAYRHMKDPVAVEEVAAGYGIDIGETMIGMHMRPVAVPIHGDRRTIGQARVIGAFSRPRLVGGIRARYSLEEADAWHE
jgi:uncharacterized protein (TIGR01440 family)